MKDGLQRKQVYIDRPVDVQDATGDPVRGWEPLGGFWWAQVEPLTAKEFARDAGIRGVMDTRFTFRWSLAFEEVDERYRIRYRDRVFNIVSVIEKRSEKREMEVMALSGQNEG